jgi:hypothetical protein
MEGVARDSQGVASNALPNAEALSDDYFVHNCPTETILIASSIPEGQSALSGTGRFSKIQSMARNETR